MTQTNTCDIKAELIGKLNSILKERADEAQQSIEAARESRDSDTKSSAGDKYETGREMAQQELDKYMAQLAKARNMLKDLERIDPAKKLEQVEYGSLVTTNLGNYFISTALGKISVGGSDYFCLSLASPIGQQLAGKKAGDALVFNGREISIQSIS